MIVTVTPNPSLDRTMEIDAFTRGAVVRARTAGIDAGGKGVNVTRALSANGHPTRAILPAGGFEGDQFLAVLETLAIDVVRIRASESVRVNITVVEPDGTTTKLNEPGPRLSDDEAEAILAATVESAGSAGWVALCGSLPPGVPVDFYRRVAESVSAVGSRVAVDSSGKPFAAALEVPLDVIKPNQHELAEATGHAMRTFGDVVEAGEQLRARGIGTVVVSLGSDGAILVDDTGAVHAQSPSITPRSTVGAGDALLAGFLAAGGRSAEALREAVAWGTAAAQLPGTTMPGPDDLDVTAVTLGDVDRDRPVRSTS